MKLFTPEKENYARWRYQTLQVGNRATEVILYQIWCASEVSTGLNFCFLLYKCLQQEFNIFSLELTEMVKS